MDEFICDMEPIVILFLLGVVAVVGLGIKKAYDDKEKHGSWAAAAAANRNSYEDEEDEDEVAVENAGWSTYAKTTKLINPGMTKTCRSCGKTIKAYAGTCPHCKADSKYRPSASDMLGL